MSIQKPIEEIVAGWEDIERPPDGAQYRHYKGGQYEIVATGFLEDSQMACVIYRSMAEDIVWVRTAENFLEDVEYNGQTIPRFKMSS